MRARGSRPGGGGVLLVGRRGRGSRADHAVGADREVALEDEDLLAAGWLCAGSACPARSARASGLAGVRVAPQDLHRHAGVGSRASRAPRLYARAWHLLLMAFADGSVNVHGPASVGRRTSGCSALQAAIFLLAAGLRPLAAGSEWLRNEYYAAPCGACGQRATTSSTPLRPGRLHLGGQAAGGLWVQWPASSSSLQGLAVLLPQAAGGRGIGGDLFHLVAGASARRRPAGRTPSWR